MNWTDKLEVRGQQWSKNLYLQKIPGKAIILICIFSEEQIDSFEGDPVIIRQWFPSKLEVGKAFEVCVPVSSQHPTKELRRTLSKRSGLPFERIELSEGFPQSTSHRTFAYFFRWMDKVSVHKRRVGAG